ncbi:hypothetical protein OPQ81_004948 [Rhizoctonia solani]|nr:hypothetical protein OPQ81_004948 [Rhizoctonia solani]
MLGCGGSRPPRPDKPVSGNGGSVWWDNRIRIVIRAMLRDNGIPPLDGKTRRDYRHDTSFRIDPASASTDLFSLRSRRRIGYCSRGAIDAKPELASAPGQYGIKEKTARLRFCVSPPTSSSPLPFIRSVSAQVPYIARNALVLGCNVR